MPISYSLDPVHRRVLTRAEGLITFQDISEHLDIEERNRDVDRPELVDARDATTDLTSDQVQQIANRIGDMLRKAAFGPTAIVTTNAALFGMARMFMVFAEGAGVAANVFRDMDAAVVWLDSMTVGT